MIPKLVVASIGVPLWLAAAFGQSFEVASVKPSKSGDGNSSTHTTNSGFIAENNSLKQLIERAYDLRDYALSGPAWLDDARFDIVAKPPAGAPKEPLRTMMQSLLVERFGLVAHRESRSVSGYALVVGKKAPVLHDLPAGAGTSTSSGSTRLTGNNLSMTDLAVLLSRQLDQPVQDQTGLPGVMDVKLEWTPDEAQADPVSDRPLSIFTALQEQLGLKLQPQKIKVDVLVIDHVERVPTEN